MTKNFAQDMLYLITYTLILTTYFQTMYICQKPFPHAKKVIPIEKG